ncbi:MAG: methyltransferase domain-containing protein [Alphaproteobacteria bacterium]|nr:methyltransferase domain-containing protein [Alphaproteobacteria bacterium]MBV8334328.1 methyltransferase domain-containing protein [Alphaproteobacteria bacterium]
MPIALHEKLSSYPVWTGISGMNWIADLCTLIDRIRPPGRQKSAHYPEDIVTDLYRGLLKRDPDDAGLQNHVGPLRAGTALEHVVRSFVTSPEFRTRMLAALVPTIDLPDLTQVMPVYYETQVVQGRAMTIFAGRCDADIDLMELLIQRHRYYDRFGVWSPVIEIDKQITAAIVRGLGAHNCFEFGCFTGPVLSLLADSGVSVAGADVSHLAFAFAYPNVRDAMIYGDLLGLDIARRFDVVLCMDVLEHINPIRLDAYIEKITSILAGEGYIYINSPMCGYDRVFGLVEEPYLEEWRTVGDASYWRHWPCDDKGWPMHGHLVWASAPWWQRKFEAHGMARDLTVEKVIHEHLAHFYETNPSRRSLFVLRRVGCRRSSAEAAATVGAALAALPGLPQTPRSHR